MKEHLIQKKVYERWKYLNVIIKKTYIGGQSQAYMFLSKIKIEYDNLRLWFLGLMKVVRMMRKTTYSVQSS